MNTNDMDARDDIYLIADELRSIADLGLHYAENDYDRERYGRALSLSARLVAAIEKRTEDDVFEEYEGSLPHATPYVAADAAVFRDGRILLIRREDNGLWAMPGGGATEVGETWAQSAERELHEEAGVEGNRYEAARRVRLSSLGHPRQVSSLPKRMARRYPRRQDSQSQARKQLGWVGFFGMSENDLPDLSPGHQRRIPLVFKLARGDLPVPYFDMTAS